MFTQILSLNLILLLSGFMTKTKLTFEDACFQWASNQFLYEELPDEYFEWSEEDQHTHLEQYAWEPIEHHYGYRIASYIDSLSQHAIEGIIPKKEDYEISSN